MLCLTPLTVEHIHFSCIPITDPVFYAYDAKKHTYNAYNTVPSLAPHTVRLSYSPADVSTASRVGLQVTMC